MITLPVNFAGDLASSTSTQIGAFSPLLLLVMGLLLALLAIGFLMRFMHPK